MTHATEEKHARTEMDGMWQRFSGRAKEMWGDLTDDEMKQYEGKYDQAMGYLKEKYGQGARAFEMWWKDESEKA